MIALELRRPPSANQLFRNIAAGGARARVKTQTYRAWVDEAAWEIRRVAGPRRITGRFGVIVVLGPCAGRAPDLDNMIKPIVDALVRGGATQDDRDLDGVIAARSGQGAFVAKADCVRVEAMEAAAFFARFGGEAMTASRESQ